jgi:alpha-beta hydrolase superfamily lysophospholipase
MWANIDKWVWGQNGQRTWLVAMAATLALLIIGLWLYLVVLRPKTHAHVYDEAFLESQIPPNLSPQYYPPSGFVWAGFTSHALPQARYGVGAPPVNSKAQALIIADADLPCEVYFELANALIADHISVWLYEAPGQGGSGHFKGQGRLIDNPDSDMGRKSVQAFIKTVIKPQPHMPLIVIGHGSGAITALNLDLAQPETTSLIVIDPYMSLALKPWTRDDIPAGHWPSLAHKWQTANPDLRYDGKSKHWLGIAKQQPQAKNDTLVPSTLVPSMSAPPKLYALSTQTKTNTKFAFCNPKSACQITPTETPNLLITQITKVANQSLALTPSL